MQIGEAPALYRGLVDGGYAGLRATGHRGDTILIGETDVGRHDDADAVPPRPLLRRQLTTGRCAAAPPRCLLPHVAEPVRFVATHPGLFQSSGYAHHPYAFDVAAEPCRPRTGHPRHAVRLRAERLTAIFSAYGSRPGGVPLYLTEWGYESNPPDPYRPRTSLGDQETWLNEGEYMTWQDPYVKSLAQFELVDNGPKAGNPAGSRALLEHVPDRPRVRQRQPQAELRRLAAADLGAAGRRLAATSRSGASCDPRTTR